MHHVALLQSSLSNVCLPVLEIFSTKHVPRIHVTMVDLIPDKCGYELEMNGKTKTPRPRRAKLNQSHVAEFFMTRMKIRNLNLANCHSKLQTTSVFDGSSAPVGLLHCAGHMKPTQQCTKQLIIALVQSRGQTWTSLIFHDNSNKLRKRLSNLDVTQLDFTPASGNLTPWK